MEKYVINGGKPLQGEVDISGAKNAAVAIIPAALMVDGICRIENMPQISDTDMLLTILTQLGAEVRVICPGTIEIDSRNVRFCDAPFELMRKIRASYISSAQCSADSAVQKQLCPVGATLVFAQSTSI